MSITNENLDILIEGLQKYADKGVVDPWYLSNGDIIQPLEALKELKELRSREDAVFAKGYRKGYFDGTKGTTAFQSEVDEAWQIWVNSGRKTHLDREREIEERFSNGNPTEDNND